MAQMLRYAAAVTLIGVGLFGLVQSLRLLTRGAPAIATRLPISATPVFLFDGATLVDASPTGAALIAQTAETMTDQAALFHVLQGPFPTLQHVCATLGVGARVVLHGARDPNLCLTVQAVDGLTRISLSAGDTAATSRMADLERASLMDELNLLRLIARETPQLIWREDATGALNWANAAYLSYADRMRPQGAQTMAHHGRVWPGERLFADVQPPDPGDPRTTGGRHALQLSGEKAEHWFEVTALPHDGSVIYYASDANATVRAEQAQRDFQQILSKTFAHLSTGLAIFNRKRQLVIFNPALLEMTGLPFGFLSARPSLDMVLDRLREMRKLPEPKHYPTWREQFSALEAAAHDGTYAERWDLTDGQTFRVTGRPHPDGALAFLFEDISAEVSLTRRFRSEIETSQAVMNALPDAVAVFSASNTLMLTNAAYDRIWQTDSDLQMTVHDLRGALRIWKMRAAPSPLWRDIEDFGRLRHDRPVLTDRLILTTGRRIDCEVSAIGGGMTLVRFTLPVDRMTDTARPVVLIGDAGRAAAS
ncbi:PAS-domain containing protein [Loktanella fryxellensis]|nr:PAS-domain containing protein [Loktanella fryxellensis]